MVKGNDSQSIHQTTGFLLVQICRAHRNRAQELLGRLNLHPGQEMMLLRLSCAEGVTQSEVAEQLCVQPATVTRMLDRLERVGLVQRQVDMADQRVSRVYLTEVGRDLIEPIQEVWQELESESFQNLTLDEQILLRRLLLQVHDNLQ